MKSAIIVLMLLVFLSGCGAEISKLPEQSKKLTLPDVVVYPKSLQQKAALEIESQSCPVLSDTFMPDYSVMRDQTRIAKKELK